MNTLTKGSSNLKSYENWASKTKFGTDYPADYVKSSRDIKFEETVKKLEGVDKQLSASRKALVTTELESQRLGDKVTLLKSYIDARSSVVEHRVATLKRTLESLAIHPGATRETAAAFIQGSKGFLNAVNRGNYLKARDELIKGEIANRDVLSLWSEKNIDILVKSGKLKPEDAAFLKNYAKNAEKTIPLLNVLIKQFEKELANAPIEEIPQILKNILLKNIPTQRPLANIMYMVATLSKDFDRVNNIITPLSNELNQADPSLESSKVAKELASSLSVSPMKRLMTYEGFLVEFIKSPVNSNENKNLLNEVKNHVSDVGKKLQERIVFLQTNEAQEIAKQNVSTVSGKVTAFATSLIRRLTPFTLETPRVDGQTAPPAA